MSPMTGYLSDNVLAEALQGTDWAPPSSVYLALHRATTLAAAVSSGASSIDVNDQVTQDAKLVLDPGQTAEETVYAGSVSDNGDGTYTVSLVDSGGSGTTTSNSHDSGDNVKFEPRSGDLTEPSGGSYGRISDTFSKVDQHHYHNDSEVNFTDMPACTVTHVGLYDALTGGNLMWFGELVDSGGSPKIKSVDAGDTLQIPANDLDVTTGLYNS